MAGTARFLIIDGDSERAESLKSDHWEWSFPIKKTVVGYEKDVPVSALRIFDAQLQLSNAPFFSLNVLGIGGVFTDPGYRGRGIASRMLQFVTRRIYSEEVVWNVSGLCLFSGQRSLYLNSGFQVIGTHRREQLMYWPIIPSVGLKPCDYWETIPEHF